MIRYALSALLILLPLPLFAGSGPNGLTALQTISPTEPLTDLKTLDPLIQGASVIGLGESNHGTTQDSTRHRILRKLVEENGFRIILAEHSVPSTLQAVYQNYIKRCEGDPSEFRKNLSSPVFRTPEWRDLFNWVCKFNLAHPKDQIEFFGIDTIVDPQIMVDWIEKLKTAFPNDSELASRIAPMRSDCFGAKYPKRLDFYASEEFKQARETGTIPETSYRSCMDAANYAEQFIFNNQRILTKKFTRFENAILRMMPGTLRACQTDYFMMRKDLTASQNSRTRQQARNFVQFWNLLGPNKKAIFLAHNYHIAKHQSELAYTGWPNVKSAGEWLNAALGPKYRSIALTQYYSKAFYSPNPLISNQADSLDGYLNQQPEDFYLINPRGRFFSDQKKWSIHAEEVPILLSRQFDALIYQREAPASFVLP